MKDGNKELAVIMFTDLVGYTKLTQQNQQLALELLELHHKSMSVIIEEHNGNIIKTIGDAFLVKFSSTTMAVNCAMEMQKTQTATNESQTFDRQVQMRIGIHLGEIVNHKNDIYGDGVNIASRIESMANPGGICISKAVYDQVHQTFKQRVFPIGEKELKNINTPMELYNIEPGNLTETKIINISKLRENLSPKAQKHTQSKKRLFISIGVVVILIITGTTLLFYVKRAENNLRQEKSYQNNDSANIINNMNFSSRAKKQFYKIFNKLTECKLPSKVRTMLNRTIINKMNKHERHESKNGKLAFKKLDFLELKISTIISFYKVFDTKLDPSGLPPSENLLRFLEKFHAAFIENDINRCNKTIEELKDTKQDQ